MTNVKHYKVPDLVAINIDTFCLNEDKLTELDCVNEAAHELEVMESWEAEGWEKEQYGDDHGKYRRQLTSYLTRQRKRGIVPDRNYAYLDDETKKL